MVAGMEGVAIVHRGSVEGARWFALRQVRWRFTPGGAQLGGRAPG
ncbi:hypothetical protein XCR_3054 [Xanthomonas campestris pv. raphani 756C]|nr:hypothetical protein XCR_3054 [Xanthomonas campestris pv. raphani 756C]